MACRIRPTLEELLQPSQCGRPGNTIFQAVATVRGVIAYAEVAQTPLCVLSLDFEDVFDRISQKYLFAILQCYGFSDAFVELIKHTYNNAKSVVQIKGYISAPSKNSAQQDRDAH